MKIHEVSAPSAEDIFTEIFLKLPVPLIIYDSESFKIKDANERASDLYGYSRQKLCSLTIYDICEDINSPSFSLTPPDNIINLQSEKLKLFLPLNNVIYADKRGEKADEEIKNKISQLAAIAVIGNKALEVIEIFALMDAAVTTIKQVLKVNYAEILEFYPSENMFSLKSAAGWDKGFAGNIKIGAGTASEAGYAMLFNKPVIVEDLKKRKPVSKEFICV